jgi:hypothetical protein
MLKKILVFSLIVFVVSCASSKKLDDSTPNTGTTIFYNTIKSNCAEITHDEASAIEANLGGSLACVAIDGTPCYVWKQKTGASDTSTGYGGLSCDYGDR